MNERIKELLVKAGWDGYEALDERNQKFAESVVMECTKILADNSEFKGCVIIVKHFGVKE